MLYSDWYDELNTFTIVKHFSIIVRRHRLLVMAIVLAPFTLSVSIRKISRSSYVSPCGVFRHMHTGGLNVVTPYHRSLARLTGTSYCSLPLDYPHFDWIQAELVQSAAILAFRSYQFYTLCFKNASGMMSTQILRAFFRLVLLLHQLIHLKILFSSWNKLFMEL